ncbi:DUF2779 domain-containing protein [Patescibacteria group bacterium]|nr:DUF2779 domain-containing protein [Patescibacteria group bacterium]
MNHYISKTDFVRYLECPLYAWLWKNRPELREGHQNSRIADQGYEVEQIAHGLFEAGKEVQGNYEEAERNTKELIKTGVNVLYQATALADHYLARADILKRDDEGKWHLYEVKSSTKKKPEHVADLFFQLYAFTKAGLELASINLVRVNNEYVYNADKGLEVDQFLKTEDLTDEIREKASDFEPQIEEAFKLLTSESEPIVKTLKKSFKYELPAKFEEYYRRGIPEYSIYDISGIRKGNLEKLSDMGIKMIADIPDGFFSSDPQNLQAELTKQKTEHKDIPMIKAELGMLEYPLYFLDYETINPAIPLFDQTRPYQQIPFQYSLHVIDEVGAEPRHMDFLHTEKTNPIPPLLGALRGHIGGTGTVLVWNETFEKGCNTAMGESCPEHAGFMADVNGRVYDLMKIFKDKYQDYRFKGSASIKNVLPILAPELSYKSLEIQHGGMAMDGIIDLIEDKAENREDLIEDLKTYCGQDTFAMVRIFDVLINL